MKKYRTEKGNLTFEVIVSLKIDKKKSDAIRLWMSSRVICVQLIYLLNLVCSYQESGYDT